MKKKISAHIRTRRRNDGSEYYHVILELGTDPLTGKRKQVYYKVEGTREDAEKEKVIKLAEWYNESLIEPSKQKLEKFLNEFVTTYVETQSASTKRYYKNVFDSYIIPAFGQAELQKLTTLQIQRVYNDWMFKSSPKSDKPLAVSTVKLINRALKCALNYAVELEYIRKNPATKIKFPKNESGKKLEVYTAEELQQVLSVVIGTDLELPFALLMEGALRRGELLGLRYEDVDFDRKTISIRQALVETEDCKKPAFSNCKTSSSRRDIIVSDYTIELIRKELVKYKENKLRLGRKFKDKGLIVCQPNGEWYLPKSFSRKWTRLLEEHNLRHIKLHGLRHSVITMLMDSNVPVHVVQHRAGHADAQMTLNVYSHMSKNSEHIVSDILEQKLFSHAEDVTMEKPKTNPTIKLVK